MQFVPGFWTATATTQIGIVASVFVDGKAGRLLGTTIEATGQADAEGGFACEGGAEAFAQSSEMALKDVARKIGEAISNSDRVRKGL
jgi:hypothetical protein